MDNDSYILEFSKDPYNRIKANTGEFGTSEFDIQKMILVIVIKMKKAISKFKDELKSILVEEFCGLRAKCYSYLNTVD